MNKTFSLALGFAILMVILVTGGIYLKKYKSIKSAELITRPNPVSQNENQNPFTAPVFIPANLTLTEPRFPNAQFKIKNFYKIHDQIPPSLCAKLNGASVETNYISCKVGKSTIDGIPAELLVIEFTINNPSDQRVFGNFFKASWINSLGETYYGEIFINWASFWADRFSTKEWAVGFRVPENVNTFQINFGNYMIESNGGDFSNKYTYQIDFESQIIRDLTGS